MPEFLFVSFHDYSQASLELAVKVKEGYKDQPPIDYLVSIQQGGALVSKILSDIFNVPVATIVVSSYNDLGQTQEPMITQDISTDLTGKNVLILDDVSDTGDTLHLVLEHLAKRSPASLKTATIFIKPKTRFMPDFWSKETDKWIVFPCELRETAEALRKMDGVGPEVIKEFQSFLQSHGVTDQLQAELNLIAQKENVSTAAQIEKN